ncbi:MAG: EamA family transporter [Nitriliruptorales bacterium]|nr:EamA family transporter [Nitriliruptorales bacterium]
MALGSAGLFSVNGTASKVVLEAGVSSVHLVELRSLGAALCLLALVAVVSPGTLRATRSEIGFLALYGVTGVALVQWFYFVAIARLPVAIALLLEYTAPLLVALWVRFVRHEEVRVRVWAALALSLAGLALVTKAWAGGTLDPLGVAAGLAAAVSLATYYLLSEHGLGQRDTLSLTAWTLGFSALLWSIVQPWWTLPFDVLSSDVALPASLGAMSSPVWLVVVGIVLLGTVAPFLLVLSAISELGATRVGLLGMAEPVGAGLAAWVVLGEVLDGPQLLGAAIVLAGIALAETARLRQPQHERQAPLPEGIAP